MQSIWSGSILTSEIHNLKDISLCTFSDNAYQAWPSETSLRFLSVVVKAQIPLHMIVGPRYFVTTNDLESQRWFESILSGGRLLSQDEGTKHHWWDHAGLESPLGVLFGVNGGLQLTDYAGVKVTELLVFASRDLPSSTERLPTPPRSSPSSQPGATSDTDSPRFNIYAVPLSSELLRTPPDEVRTPPTSPSKETDKIEGTFIPTLILPNPTEPMNHPPIRKRKSLTDTFDTATDRLRKAKRKGGESVSAAAAASSSSSSSGTRLSNPTIPQLAHRRSISTNSHPTPLQTRPLSRASSTASARPSSARELQSLPKRSSLSTLRNGSRNDEGAGSRQEDVNDDDEGVEVKNKDVISRIVMAGMRLHGLSQSSRRQSRVDCGSVSATPVLDLDGGGEKEGERRRRRDEEFKLVYHHVYKGTCFAFREYISGTTLGLHSGAVRETVDRLLGIFCADPLMAGGGGMVLDEEKLTPGGRKAFGTGGGGVSGVD